MLQQQGRYTILASALSHNHLTTAYMGQLLQPEFAQMEQLVARAVQSPES